MTVFLDIGAHRGMTVDAALDYGFEHVYAFEPMPREFAELEAFYGNDPRVTLCNFGLSDETGQRPVYGTNDRYEASIHRGSSWVQDDAPVTVCEFVNATDWFRDNLPDGALAVCKMNCEASEADIFDSLIDSLEIWKIAAVTICWDVRLVPGLEHREAKVRRRFARMGFHQWHLLAACKGPTHKARIWEWLDGLPRGDWMPPALTPSDRERRLLTAPHGC